MEIKKINEKEYPLLDRKEVLVKVISPNTPTPSRNDLRKGIAKLFKSKEEMISINKVKQGFGGTEVLVTARIYSNLETLKKIELKKNILEPKKEEPKEEAKPEEPKKEEAKPEEPKEEVKKE